MKKYADYIMEFEREKRGLKNDDFSQDFEIEQELSNGEKMSKSSDIQIDKEAFWNN